jgi:hypothetical protein
MFAKKENFFNIYVETLDIQEIDLIL